MAYQRKSRGENIYLFEFSTCSHRGCYFIGALSFSNAKKPIISQIIFNIPMSKHSLIITGSSTKYLELSHLLSFPPCYYLPE